MLAHFRLRDLNADRAAGIDVVPNRRLEWLGVKNFFSASA